jgi:hypothetical protein
MSGKLESMKLERNYEKGERCPMQWIVSTASY